MQHGLLCVWAAKTLGGCLAWIAWAGRSEGRKAGGPCRSPWALVQPRHAPLHIDRGGDGYVLPVGLGQAPIPRASQPQRASALRKRPFDAGAPLLALDALLTGIPGPGGGERLILLLGRQPPPAALRLGLGA